MAAAPSRTQKESAVADAVNWRQRILSELQAAKRWEAEWGPIFKGDPAACATVSEQIREKEEQLRRLKDGQSGMSTTTRASFRGTTTLEKFGHGSYGKRKMTDLMPSIGHGVDY